MQAQAIPRSRLQLCACCFGGAVLPGIANTPLTLHSQLDAHAVEVADYTVVVKGLPYEVDPIKVCHAAVAYVLTIQTLHKVW